MKSLKFIEPGTKAILFTNKKWKIWHTDMSGRPTHGAMMRRGDAIPLLTAHLTSKSEYLLISFDKSVSVTDPVIQRTVDKAVGVKSSTILHIETADDRCECDLREYLKRCGRELGENPKRKKR